MIEYASGFQNNALWDNLSYYKDMLPNYFSICCKYNTG